MKPTKAKNIPVISDLCLHSYRLARDLAKKSCTTDFPDIYLKVSFLRIDAALEIYVLDRNCYILITPFYAGDEWSVLVGESEVYSPGC